MRSLQDAGGEFGTYAYLSWCLENSVPLPVDLLACLAARGWIIQDHGEIKPAEVEAISIIAEEEQINLFEDKEINPEFAEALDNYRPCDTK